MRLMRVFVMCLTLFAFGTTADLTNASEYVFQDLRLPGAEFTTPLDINNNGVVVGVAGDVLDELPLLGGFVWRDGEFLTPEIGFLDAAFSSISDSGLIAGTGFDFFTFTTPVFILELESGEMETFELPDGLISFPGGINGKGELVGAYFSLDDEFRSFILRDDEVQTISIAGLTEIGAADINDAGQIVGGALNADGIAVGFILQDDVTTFFQHPDGETELLAINNLGHIAGSVFDAEGSRAFVYDGSSFHDVAFPGGDETVIWGMNDHGVLVGEYFVAGIEEGFGFIARPVPEPRSSLLAYLAFAGACWRKRSRSRH